MYACVVKQVKNELWAVGIKLITLKLLYEESNHL